MANAMGYQAGPSFIGMVAMAARVLVTSPIIPRIHTYRVGGSGANAAVM